MRAWKKINKLFTGLGSVRIVKNCDLGLENADLGHSFLLYGPRSRQMTYISLSENDISLSENDISLSENDISLNENDISQSVNDISPRNKTIAVTIYRSIYRLRLISV